LIAALVEQIDKMKIVRIINKRDLLDIFNKVDILGVEILEQKSKERTRMFTD